MKKHFKISILFVISILVLSACTAASGPRPDEIPPDGRNKYAEVFVMTPGTSLLSIDGKDIKGRIGGVFIFLKPGIHVYFYEAPLLTGGTTKVDQYYKDPATGRYIKWSANMPNTRGGIFRASIKLEEGKRYKWEPTFRRIVYRDFEPKKVMGMFPEFKQDFSKQPKIMP